MATAETNSNGVKNPVGVYRHDESGAELIAVTPIQGDAFVRLGYKYVGPAPKKSDQSNESKKGSK